MSIDFERDVYYAFDWRYKLAFGKPCNARRKDDVPHFSDGLHSPHTTADRHGQVEGWTGDTRCYVAYVARVDMGM